ncbi:MAG: C-type lectin domain-containing protein, partial [Synechococcaceae bacterium WB9_2_112]|nr:C-type lectin domain-containing protein [Synechococcaceae bacterium WB9_2_112]
DWGSISFLPDTYQKLVDGSATYRPGEVTFSPGSRYPAVAQFTAATDGIYGIDARFWKSRSETSTTYKVFKVAANGTISELDAGGSVGGSDPAGATRSSLEQILLSSGEKLLFAVHKGGAGNSNSNDETSASLHINLLANKVTSGSKDYYYNLSTGHYIGLSTGAATWSNAGSEASNLTVAGQSGYLATTADTTSQRIARALLAKAGLNEAWAGAKAVGGSFYWSSGPLQGQSINAGGNSLTASGYNTTTVSTSQRYLVEFGSSALAVPSSLSSSISQSSAAGNTLIIDQAGRAYSARSGHYYTTDSTQRAFNAALATAETSSVAGQAGYLARLGSLEELQIGGWFARQTNTQNLWLGLYQTDTSNEPAQGWQWISGDGGTTTNDANFALAGYQQWLPGQPDGNTPTTTLSNNSYDSGTTFGSETVLGLYGSSQSSSTTLSLNNNHSRISFEFWQIDSWESETFRVYIDNTLLFTSPALQVGTSSLTGAPYVGSTTINGKTVTYSVAAANSAGVYGGDPNYSDQKFTVSIDLPKDFASS